MKNAWMVGETKARITSAPPLASVIITMLIRLARTIRSAPISAPR
jgi:hypothetical protein